LRDRDGFGILCNAVPDILGQLHSLVYAELEDSDIEMRAMGIE
jgi:hypothetical protein